LTGGFAWHTLPDPGFEKGATPRKAIRVHANPQEAHYCILAYHIWVLPSSPQKKTIIGFCLSECLLRSQKDLAGRKNKIKQNKRKERRQTKNKNRTKHNKTITPIKAGEED
jgi:hypothetical protein